MTTTVMEHTSGRALIPEGLFRRLTNRIVAEKQIEQQLAERIMDQALAFLAGSAHHTGEPLAPSAVVDDGWHTFLLYTRDYAEFCERVAGRLIHHVPHDDIPDHHAGPSTGCARTLAAIRAAGYSVDPELWTARAARCDPDKCSASGSDGNENTETQTGGR